MVSLVTSSVLLMGIEADGDSIDSFNNLGRHARNRAAGYLDLDLHPAKKRWSPLGRSAYAKRVSQAVHQNCIRSPSSRQIFALGDTVKSSAPAEATASAFRLTPISTTLTQPPSAMPNSNPNRHGAETPASTGIPTRAGRFRSPAFILASTTPSTMCEPLPLIVGRQSISAACTSLASNRQ